MAQKSRVFELEGLKFEIGKLKIEVPVGDDGEKQIKEALTENLGLALAPVAQAMRAQLPPAAAHSADTAVNVTPEKRSPRRSGRTRTGASAPAGVDAVPLDWKPDIRKYGNPSLSWSTFEKGAWLLHCYTKENGAKGLSIPVIVATFNKHFSHSKTITLKYMNRDFGRQAAADRPKVIVDNNQSPPMWFLTDAGTAQIEDLIKKASTPLLVSGAA